MALFIQMLQTKFQSANNGNGTRKETDYKAFSGGRTHFFGVDILSRMRWAGLSMSQHFCAIEFNH